LVGVDLAGQAQVVTLAHRVAGEGSACDIHRLAEAQALTNTDLDDFYAMFSDSTKLDTCVETTLHEIVALQPSFR
jgi:hypothetical protein